MDLPPKPGCKQTTRIVVIEDGTPELNFHFFTIIGVGVILGYNLEPEKKQRLEVGT